MTLGERIELRKQELEYQEAQREKNKRICEKNGFLYAKHGEVLSKIFFRQLAAKQALTKTMEDTKGRILNKPAEIRKELNQIYKNIFNQEDNYREGDIEKFLGEKGLNRLGRIDQGLKEKMETEITEREFEAVCQKLNKESTTGQDGITANLIIEIKKNTQILSSKQH